MDEDRKRKLVNLTTHLLDGMVERGEVDLDDDAALKKAANQCVRDANQVLNAVEEFLCG